MTAWVCLLLLSMILPVHLLGRTVEIPCSEQGLDLRILRILASNHHMALFASRKSGRTLGSLLTGALVPYCLDGENGWLGQTNSNI